MTAFHEILFPLDIALKSAGGPERRTEIVSFGSGREARNARWADSRRRYDAGYGIKTLAALQSVVAFFEERRGRLHGFRWRDRLDHASSAPGLTPSPLDQGIGIGDGVTSAFPLLKTYGAGFAPYARRIAKPVDGSVRIGGEIAGAFDDATLTEADLAAGRYDAAAVETWLVDWSDVSLRVLTARGRLG
ncbi:MAG: hypothetical protein JWO28_2287 [Hyphomicrobiales bacterium]|nr:hypothetical protein [Hyphomicrobiales bacterium]